MNDNINVASAEVSTILSQFQGEMQKMSTLFEEIKTQTAHVNSYWTGQASEAAVEALNNFMKVFEDISSQNEKYVSFLNGVIEMYTTTDQGISNTIDSAANNGL